MSAVPPNLDQTEPSAFPLWLLGIGLILIVGSGVITWRLIWEQTVLTWECGVQMVGFSLAHVSPLVILLLFPPALALWASVSLAYIVWRLWRGRPLSRVSLAAMGLSLALLVAFALPYEFWLELFEAKLSRSPRAGDFFSSAAAAGNLPKVKRFLARGTPIDVRDRYYGRTALHAAAHAGETEVVKYLIAEGADANAIDREGNSPLGLATSLTREESAVALRLALPGSPFPPATSLKREESARYLAEQGANMVLGSEEQYEKFKQDSFRKISEKLDSGECAVDPWAPFNFFARDKPR